MLQHLDTFIAFAVVMVGVSLLITILTQMTSAFFGVRGTNLKWGIEELLRTIDPNLDKHAGEIANKILQHPSISDSTFSKYEKRLPWLAWLTQKIGSIGRLVSQWRLASTIRPEEFLFSLRTLAHAPLQKRESADWQRQLEEALTESDANAEARFHLVTRKIQDLSPEVIKNLDTLFPQLAVSAQKAIGDIEQGFDSTMDRVSQRFAMQMRIWTVVFSFLLAFVLHLDAFRLSTQLSSDATVRASLVAAAETISRQAGDVLGKTSSSPFVEAMKQLKIQDPLANQLLAFPPVLESNEEAETWIREQVKDSDQAEKLVKAFRNVLQATLRTRMDSLKVQVNSLKDELNKTEFQLVPDPYPGWDFLPYHPQWKRHLAGILCAAALLSLGAPFWFNILKTLTNLRPLLATKQQKEREQSSG
ncbi:MAG: hypothetical protein LAO31_11975 [Acidobacteriia bacterium]|nr:hypothetical protein [Terriglobia bacterium]